MYLKYYAGELEVKEVAQGKSAYQSSTYIHLLCPSANSSLSADLAIDGNTSPSLTPGCSCSHTVDHSFPAWWLVDLGAVLLIHYILVFNRAESLGELQLFAIS